METLGVEGCSGLEITYLPTTGFDHELPGQVRSWLWLQWADNNALVQRITGDDLEGREVSGSWDSFPEDSGPEAGILEHP